MIGKVSPEGLNKFVYSRLGAVDESVTVGPAYGEDTAAIDLGDQVLVINSDPIIYAADRIGTLGVNIASNDLAASGAEPKWMTVTYLLPDSEKNYLDEITRQIDDASKDLGIAVVGGHSEYVSGIERPFLSLTCFGLTYGYIPTGGVKPGDKLILTKGAGIEATGILATDFRNELEGQVADEELKKGAERLNQLSVLPEGLILKDYATGMHDPTEGGVLAGLFEMASVSGQAFEVDRDKIVVNSDTEKICEAAGVDPLKVFGSGALIASVSEGEVQEALDMVRNDGIKASVIGEARVSEEPRIRMDGEVVDEPTRDQLYDLWD
ncbi:AIR synthase family protein [Candidatus Bipolaricaulota bacterium]|nr:AIR synthase family protein [Candidatus Bipolaricaulota bacterium]